MRKTRIGIFGALAAFAALVTVSAPAPAVDAAQAQACDCWYRGWEDSKEFPIESKDFSDGFKSCDKKGETPAYDDGYDKGHKNKPRKCPFEN